MRDRHALRAVLLLVAVLVVAAGLQPGVARAADPLRLYVANVYYGRGLVELAGSCASGTAAVRLYAGSTRIAVEAVGARTKVMFAPYRLKSATTFTARGYDASGTALWSTQLRLDPASYRPLRPSLSVPNGKLVGSRWSFSGNAYRPVTKARAYCYESDRSWTVTMTPENSGGFYMGRLAVPYGGAEFHVKAANGFGWSPTRVINVYYLGSDLPTRRRWEFVCKHTFWLLDVYDRRVIHRWPVAIGTPRTPTPTGTFYIGRPQSASGDWGVLRRPLYRKRDGHYYRSGYYIHGTDAPWSIGTMASHGCVRMYNRDVRVFAKVVPNYTLVRIR